MTKTLTLLPIAVGTLRRRWSGFVGSFVALTLGVALIGATGLLVNGSLGANPDPAAPSLKKLLSFMAGMAGFVCVFVVASTFAFAVAQRRQETALLRAVGATSRQVRLLVLAEAMAVGVLAAFAGCALSLVIAPGFAAWLVGQALAPRDFTARPGAAALLIAAGTGLLVALVGAFAASRRAGRVRPTEALSDAAADRRVMTLGRWLWALLYLALFGTVAALFATMAGPMARDPELRNPQNTPMWTLLFDIMAVIAVALFAPVLVPPLVRLLTLPTRLLRGPSGLLARQNALVAIRRTVSTATPAFLVIGLTGTVVGGTLSFADAREVQESSAVRARYAVTAADTGLSAAALGRLRALPGTAVTTTVPVTLDGLSQRTSARAGAMAVGGDLATAWDLPTDEGSVRQLHGLTVAVATDLARAHGWQLGDELPTTLDDGTPVGLRLVALVRPPQSLAEVLVPSEAMAGHLGGALPTTAYVTAPSGTGPQALADALKGTEAAHADVSPARQQVTAEARQRTRYDTTAMIAILGPALLYALLAIVNTMMMSTGDRLRDFGLLRLAGGSRRQVLASVALESTLVVAVATALGLLVTAGTQYATTALINSRFLAAGTALPVSLPWPAVGAGTVACLLLALLACLVPARIATRDRSREGTP
ncbi:ABC transporter permease [Streptomyces sp. NPDC052496]|uniref:ABC transporter permease n=1 Tax=Streptomyces sp. NPDC052496 TaxID=3154951 RepID=UPI00343599A8